MSEIKSLFICGHCGKDTRKTDRDIEKVRAGGCTNLLCRSCVIEFEDEINKIARKYLRRK